MHYSCRGYVRGVCACCCCFVVVRLAFVHVFSLTLQPWHLWHSFHDWGALLLVTAGHDVDMKCEHVRDKPVSKGPGSQGPVNRPQNTAAHSKNISQSEASVDVLCVRCVSPLPRNCCQRLAFTTRHRDAFCVRITHNWTVLIYDARFDKQQTGMHSRSRCSTLDAIAHDHVFVPGLHHRYKTSLSILHELYHHGRTITHTAKQFGTQQPPTARSIATAVVTYPSFSKLTHK